MKLYNSEYLDKSADPTFPAKLESYNLLNLKEIKKILDLGCGTGFDALNMAKVKAGTGVVYGLDLDPSFIEIANTEKASKNITNVEFLIGSAESLPFQDNELDAVRIERVFQHLLNPNLVWQEIKRVLKPGGSLVIVETDWKGLSFFSPNYEVSDNLVNFLVHKRLNYGMASRNLVTDMVKNGFNKLSFEVIPISITNYKLANIFIKIDDLAALMIKKHIFSKAEFEEWILSFNPLEQSKSPIGLLNMFVTKSIL